MDLTELRITPSAKPHCRGCNAEVPSGALACPQCDTLIYGHHLEQISKAANNLEESKLPGRLAEARELWLSALLWLPRGSEQAAWIRQHVLALDARINSADPAPTSPSKWAKRLGTLAPLAVLFAKAKTALLFLFKLKFLLSFAAFLGVYWALYGLWFGAGFAISILIHEFGHVVAVRRLGLKADLPVFLPGFGAYVRWQGFAISVVDRSAIALAGPLAGLSAALARMAIYITTKKPVFAALAHMEPGSISLT